MQRNRSIQTEISVVFVTEILCCKYYNWQWKVVNCDGESCGYSSISKQLDATAWVAVTELSGSWSNCGAAGPCMGRALPYCLLRSDTLPQLAVLLTQPGPIDSTAQRYGKPMITLAFVHCCCNLRLSVSDTWYENWRNDSAVCITYGFEQ